MSEKIIKNSLYGEVHGEPWTEQEPYEDDLDDFLREIYADTGYTDVEIEEMAREWEEAEDEMA